MLTQNTCFLLKKMHIVKVVAQILFCCASLDFTFDTASFLNRNVVQRVLRLH